MEKNTPEVEERQVATGHGFCQDVLQFASNHLARSGNLLA